ncbi:hypothetical protein [Pandoraea iniqua]|uniref:hypothetical protein n=1 Tax=Pandoraea iniqua TaxID=2508288 RepID=UPI001582C1BC|nr:hypothetical protein [Pandoraea iniqua]
MQRLLEHDDRVELSAILRELRALRARGPAAGEGRVVKFDPQVARYLDYYYGGIDWRSRSETAAAWRALDLGVLRHLESVLTRLLGVRLQACLVNARRRAQTRNELIDLLREKEYIYRSVATHALLQLPVGDAPPPSCARRPCIAFAATINNSRVAVCAQDPGLPIVRNAVGWQLAQSMTRSHIEPLWHKADVLAHQALQLRHGMSAIYADISLLEFEQRSVMSPSFDWV